MQALVEAKAKLALYGNTALPLAGSLGESDVQEFFRTETFKDFLKHMESRDQARAMIFERFDKVLIGMSRLGRALSFSRRR